MTDTTDLPAGPSAAPGAGPAVSDAPFVDDQAVDPRSARTIIAVLLVAVFVVILNETIMGVALPRLMTDLGIQAGTGQWLSTAFMLTMAVVIPTTGFLLQRLPTRTVFVLAMGLFSAGTLIAGVAPNFWVLLGARVVQGSGTAIMLPLLMTTVLTLVPLERRGVVMGNISIAISVAPAIGPTVSGLILQFLPWRFMFLIVLPIALAALAIGAPRLTSVGERGHTPLDLRSVFLTVPAFGLLVLGLSQVGQARSATGLVVAGLLFAVGVVCLVVFGLRQRRLQRVDGALLDLRPFGFSMFSRALAMMCIAMTGLFGIVILLPIYLQTIRGLESLPTGLLLLPGGLVMGVLGPVVGRLFDRYGPRGLTIFGSSLLVATMFGFSTVTATTPIWMLLGLHVALSVGLAFMFTPAFTTALNPLPPYLYSHGSAILSTLQQVAGAAGVALLVTVLAIRSSGLVATGTDALAATNAGIRTAFLVAAVLSIGAVVLASTLRRTGPLGGPGGHGGHGPAPADSVGNVVGQDSGSADDGVISPQSP